MNVLGLIVFWLVIAELFVVLNIYLYRVYVSWRKERTARKEQQHKEESN